MKDPLVVDLEWLTRGIRAIRIVRATRNQEMDRLTEKLSRAAGVVKRVGDRLEARADRLIAREEAADRREDEVFSPHEERMGIAERGMDIVERALSQMSNGDPLPNSESGLIGEQSAAPLGHDSIASVESGR